MGGHPAHPGLPSNGLTGLCSWNSLPSRAIWYCAASLPAPLTPTHTFFPSFIHLGAGSCCIAQTVFRLLSILLSQPPKCWNCIHYNRLPYSLRLTSSPWTDVPGLFSPSLVLCPGDTCARQACVVQRHGCLVKETDLKPLPDCLPSVCHTLQHLSHLFCGPPSGCEMEPLCGLT